MNKQNFVNVIYGWSVKLERGSQEMKRKLHVGGGRSSVKIDLEILIVGGTSEQS